jgi:hypothetical protein
MDGRNQRRDTSMSLTFILTVATIAIIASILLAPIASWILLITVGFYAFQTLSLPTAIVVTFLTAVALAK